MIEKYGCFIFLRILKHVKILDCRSRVFTDLLSNSPKHSPSPGYEGTENIFISYIILLFFPLTKRKPIYEARLYSFEAVNSDNLETRYSAIDQSKCTDYPN